MSAARGQENPVTLHDDPHPTTRTNSCLFPVKPYLHKRVQLLLSLQGDFSDVAARKVDLAGKRGKLVPATKGIDQVSIKVVKL